MTTLNGYVLEAEGRNPSNTDNVDQVLRVDNSNQLFFNSNISLQACRKLCDAQTACVGIVWTEQLGAQQCFGLSAFLGLADTTTVALSYSKVQVLN